MSNVAVVIPFYQRDTGILARSIRSICAQDIKGVQIRVVIVDDDSPIGPTGDIDLVTLPANVRVERIHQVNSGPGGARNRGLDYISLSAPDFVAFLDSDDVWEADHLSRALTILTEEIDFYGSDHSRLSKTNNKWFLRERADLVSLLEVTSFDKGIYDGYPFYKVKGNESLKLFITNYIVQTSTVVYRWKQLSNVRFDVGLRFAGEDNMFWLSCSERVNNVSIDLAPGAKCLDGVNIYASALSWDDPATITRLACLVKLWIKVRKTITLDKSTRDILRIRSFGVEKAFTFLWIRSVLRGKGAHVRVLRGIFSVDRSALPRMLSILLILCWLRVKGKKIDFLEH